MVGTIRMMLSWKRSAHEGAVWRLLKRTGIQVLRGRFTGSDASVDAVVPGTMGRVRELLDRLEAAGIRATALESEAVIG
jgi:hypothetical protein